MAIVRLKKLTFCGLLTEKSAVLNALQENGGAHLIALNNCITPSPAMDSRLAENTVQALKYLNSCANKRHQVFARNDFDLEQVVNKTLELQTTIRNLTDERDAIKKRIQEVEPWGNFILPDPTEFNGLKFWFYIVPQRLMKKLPTEKSVWQVVYRDNLTCYVVVIAEEEPSPDIMPVSRTHTGTRSLETLKKRLNFAELKLEDKQAERESMTRWISLISLQLSQEQDRSILQNAHNITLDESNIFALQAWVDQSHVNQFKSFAKQHQLALLIEDPNETDQPPTLLKNSISVAGAEDLISFYQTPSYSSWDPTIIVFWSVAIFFAMILSDAGYAAIFGLYLAVKWRNLNQGAGKRIRTLLAVTVLFSIVWGILIGSYFGYILPEQSFLAHFKLLDLEDFDSMMVLSIGIGVLHLTLSNLVMAYQRRGKITVYASLGWAALTLGGFALWRAQTLHLNWLEQASYGVLALGAFGILCCSGHEPIRTISDALHRLMEGLHSLTDISKIFGNTLSYMRLFALGLAGASLALTFNNLAGEVYHALPGLGLLCSILIVLFGHTLNIVLCLLSGVLHGLRLNFIEFFNWSLTEEGYPFKAFSKTKSTD